MFRSFSTICAALLAATACTPLSARSLVDVSIIDRDSAQTLPEYRARGDDWVPGEPGRRYSVRLTNTTSERVLVVLSVDGVNAVSGEDADPAQAGYVLAPYETTDIAGWRKSMSDVAQFYFTDLPDSYAARTGRPDNVGVIGVAAFREAVRALPSYRNWPPVYEDERAQKSNAEQASAPPAPEASADSMYEPQATQRVGTGHGEREASPVDSTEFERATSRPAQVAQLRYDAPDRLQALGIIPRTRYPYEGAAPRAFPSGFVPEPSPRR